MNHFRKKVTTGVSLKLLFVLVTIFLAGDNKNFLNEKLVNKNIDQFYCDLVVNSFSTLVFSVIQYLFCSKQIYLSKVERSLYISNFVQRNLITQYSYLYYLNLPFNTWNTLFIRGKHLMRHFLIKPGFRNYQIYFRIVHRFVKIWSKIRMPQHVLLMW